MKIELEVDVRLANPAPLPPADELSRIVDSVISVTFEMCQQIGHKITYKDLPKVYNDTHSALPERYVKTHVKE
jgi:hypothetical protein